MENKEDNIEDLFRDRFENDEVPVSPMVWQNIKKTLPEDKSSFGFTFSQNIILWSIAGILVLSAVIGSYVHFTKNKSSTAVFYTTQPANSNSSANNTREKSTGIRSTDDSLSIIANSNQDVTQKASPDNNQDLRSKASSSNDFSPANNKASVSSIRSFNSNSTLLNKDNRPTSTKSIVSSDGQNHRTKKDNKGKRSTSNDPNITAANKRQVQKTSNVLDKNKHPLADGKDNMKKNKNQSIQSSAFLVDSVKSNNKNTITKNDSASSVKDSVKTESKHKQAINNNSLAIQTDTTQLSSISASASNSKHTLANDSVLTTYAISQDRVNKVNTQETVLNNIDKESLVIAMALDHKEGFVTDSISTSTKKETLSENVVLYSNNSSDSSTFHQAISAAHSVNKDSLSEIKNPPLIAQDSSLVKLDSLQPVQPDSVLAKTTDKKDKDKSKLLSRLSFDLAVTALLTGASTSTYSTDSSNKAAIEDKNKNDKNSLGYSAGVLVNYKVSERISASVGITYTNFSEEYHFNYTLKKTEWVLIDSTWQLIQVDSINRDSKVKDQYNFLSIPLQLSYTFLSKEKLKLSATAGIRGDILIKGVTHLANAQKTDVVKMTSGFNVFSFSYLLALEAEYKWTAHTAVLLQPVFLYGGSSIHSKTSSLKQKTYGIGLTLGLRFTF